MLPIRNRQSEAHVLKVAFSSRSVIVARPTYDRLVLDEGAVRVQILPGGPWLNNPYARGDCQMCRNGL